LLCSKVKPQGKPIDVTYIGSPALDRSELSKNLLERNGKPLNTTKLVTYILNGKIIGVVRDGSEHGPRALGNRSILCDPTFENMKDILNKKVKNREFYRPFAPVVRLEDVNKYFEWDKESRWMSFCPKVRKEYQSILKSITHIDGTARVQTVTPEQNNFLYNLLTELDKQKGIGVLLNTSFNIAGKPILNTYKDALWMLDNTQMDALVLEDYFIEKNY
jgi:carbamoyltransferase